MLLFSATIAAVAQYVRAAVKAAGLSKLTHEQIIYHSEMLGPIWREQMNSSFILVYVESGKPAREIRETVE